MQQVGRQHFSVRSAAVDPRLLPLPLRPGSRSLVGLGHVWVLHRRRVTRTMLLLIVCCVLALTYTFRDDIGVAVSGTGTLVGTQLVRAGFGVEKISISGQALTSEADVLRALRLTDATSTLALSAAGARARLEALPSVESATVRKVYPDELVVELSEPRPVARWRIDGQTRVIDAWGVPIARALQDDAELPLVIGDGAAEEALPMINLMARYPELGEELAALARIGERRWDLIYYTGLRVNLPETGVAAALARLASYQRDHQLLERDVSVIDLRLPGAVAVLPVEREED